MNRRSQNKRFHRNTTLVSLLCAQNRSNRACTSNRIRLSLRDSTQNLAEKPEHAFASSASSKLRDRSGETLAETLVALLLIALSSVLLYTMTGSASRILRKAEAGISAVYQELSDVETGNPTGDSKSVTIQFRLKDNSSVSNSWAASVKPISNEEGYENGLHRYEIPKPKDSDSDDESASESDS